MPISSTERHARWSPERGTEFRGSTGPRTFFRIAAPDIENLSVQRNGEPLSNGDSVAPGDVLSVTVETDPSGEPGILLVGTDPKPDCVLCGLDCADQSHHFVKRSFTGGTPVQLEVTQDWAARNQVTLAPSVAFTFGGDQFCLASFPTLTLNVTQPPPPPPEKCSIEVPGAGEVDCVVAAASVIGLAVISAALLGET